MSEYIKIGKKITKVIVRADSLKHAIEDEDTMRIASRGLSLADDLWEIAEIGLKAIFTKESE